jgi:hypothetical protein
LALEQLQTSLDVDVAGIKISGATVRVERVGNLVVARFVQSAQIVPDLRDVWVQADSTRIGVERIPVLVDLVVENTNRTPEGRVASVAVNGLLVGFVGLGVFGLRHVAATQEVPTLGIVVICANRLLQELNRLILALVARALLVVEPSQLLKDFGVVGIPIENTSISGLSGIELKQNH